MLKDFNYEQKTMKTLDKPNEASLLCNEQKRLEKKISLAAFYVSRKFLS